MTLLFIGKIFSFIFAVLWFLLLAYTLFDLIRRPMPTNTKLLWLIVILLAPVLGSLLYLFLGRHGRI